MLLELVDDINVEIEKLDDQRLNIAIKMAQAHDLVVKEDSEAKGMGWREFATKHFDLSWSEVKKLVKIGLSEDPAAQHPPGRCSPRRRS